MARAEAGPGVSAMEWRGEPPIPPYAGICAPARAHQPGYRVGQTVDLLLRYHYVQRRLMDAGVARIPPTPEWEVKCALSLHAWYDAEHVDAYRRRVAEMREPPLHLDRCPDAALAAWCDELEAAADTEEFLTGVYEVARPALVEAFRRHLEEMNPLADHPTLRLLRLALAEQEEAVAWGKAALAALRAAAREDIASRQDVGGGWREHLHAYLAAAGGIRGDETPRPAPPPPRTRGRPPADLTPRRDARFADQRSFGYVTDEVALDAGRPARERTWALLFKRLREMDVPEWMAGILVQTPGRPWAYYRDMVRQLWDEARHAMFGQAGFAAYGLDFTEVPSPVASSLVYGRELSATERHAVLYAIEQGLMDGRTGKKAELEAAEAADMPLAATFQDFDWADEVLHARIGREWLARPLGAAQVRAMAEGASAKALPLHYAYCGREDAWWPPFLQRALAATAAAERRGAGASVMDARSPGADAGPKTAATRSGAARRALPDAGADAGAVRER